MDRGRGGSPPLDPLEDGARPYTSPTLEVRTGCWRWMRDREREGREREEEICTRVGERERGVR
jgi:hypothetical protein